MLNNKKNVGMAAAGFGAAAATLHAVPELNADIVSITFTTDTVSYNTSSSKTNVGLGTTGGAFLGSIGQYNDSVGKSMDTQTGISSIMLMNVGDVMNLSTFAGQSSISFSTSVADTIYVGFRSASGIGWFSVDLGGSLGDIRYLAGQFGNAGESVTVGTPVPAPAGLAALAVGAMGLRGRRKRAAAS